MSQFYTPVKRRAALSKRLAQLQGKLKFAVRRNLKKLVIDTLFEIHYLEVKIEALDAVELQNVQRHQQAIQLALKAQKQPTGFMVHTDQLIPTFVEAKNGTFQSGTKMEKFKEQPVPHVKGLTGRVSRWGKWVDATVIGWCEYGTRYLVEFKRPNGDIGEMFVCPKGFYVDAVVSRSDTCA